MTAHERYADWDAAYLLGALSASDRAEYEAHLEDCGICRVAIAEIAPTLGLLARVPAERAEAMLQTSETESPAPEHRVRVLSFAAARARRRRRGGILGLSAAAVIVAVAIAVPITSSLMRAPTTTVALEQVIDAPLTATVDLAEVAWGTRIDMTCSYGPATDAPADGWAYALVVVGDDGTESVLSTWRAYPGTTARLSAGTELAASDIASIEIRSVVTGDVLMRSPADPSPRG